MRIKIFVIICFLNYFSFGQKKYICFSFDDLPVVSYGITDTNYQKQLFDKLITSLKNNNIPAIGFVNEGKLYDNKLLNPFQVNLLNNWVDCGLDIGNHTFSHSDYNSVSFKEYSKDIAKGEIESKKILGRNGKNITYFRHPFIHLGNTKAKADSLSNYLLNHGYLEAPVTIDNDDYLFAFAYQKAKVKNDKMLIEQIGNDYINYTEKRLKFYEKEAFGLFGRDISQVLLLHASLLNSDYIDYLAVMFRKNNYTFVSIDKVLEDDAYKSEITIYGSWGISWIDSWALSMGKKGDFFKDEPIIPGYILKVPE